MEEKPQYTPEEIAQIAKSYNSFLNFVAESKRLPYDDRELLRQEKASLDKIISEIPQNVRTVLGITEQTVWNKLRKYSGFEH